jgi:hypothetical protein
MPRLEGHHETRQGFVVQGRAQARVAAGMAFVAAMHINLLPMGDLGVGKVEGPAQGFATAAAAGR